MSQELELSEQLISEGFTPFNFEELTKETIIDKEVYEYIFSIDNAIDRTQLVLKLEDKAKDLGVIRKFDKMLKVYQSEYTRNFKKQGNFKIDFSNSPINDLKCKNYICNDFGITKLEYDPLIMRTKEILICTHPLLPVERLINVDSSIEKVKLAFYKDKKWQFVIAERNTLASKNKILQLANTGIEINENNAKEIITYISEVIAINLDEIPYNKAITHLGWTSNGFVPYVENFKFDGDRSFEGIYKDIKTSGNYEDWKQKMIELRQTSETLHFIIASSFASVLIEKVHINPFIVHLWGKSGTGKTVALMIAMSIWGNPGIGHLVKNLNSTNVGLERLSAFLNNIPFAGDELQAIKNKYSDFSELIYSLTQGEGKSRGTVDGGIQEQLKWNCVYITTGEEPVTLESSKEGVKNRVIEIEENKPIINNGKDIVNFLLDNYGFAGKDFIEQLPADDELIKRHSEIFNELNKESDFTGKQINSIALIILADELISKLIFKDKALTTDDGKKYFTKDVDEAERIYNLIVDYFYQNINKFNENTSGEFWGTFDTNADGSIGNFYFIPSVLKRYLSENNINFDGIKSKLFEGGYIEKDKQGKFSTVRKINGKCIRCINFFMKGNIQTQMSIDDLPF